MKPYIVSEDVRLALEPWAREAGLTLPDREFFNALRTELRRSLRNAGLAVEVITDVELQEGLRSLCGKEKECELVSLERFYLPEITRRLDTSRAVSWQQNFWKDAGLDSRTTEPISMQIRRLAAEVSSDITLVDDVIFSGESALRLILELQEFGMRVQKVLAGIVIGEGKRALEAKGIEVLAVRTFSEVTDEICQRDFFPGVPASGRTVWGMQDVGVPYIFPYGDPVAWASIPENAAEDFSRSCLMLMQELRSSIERASGLPKGSLILPRGIASRGVLQT